ncbi:MAG TPA: DUF2231 domain-containing protein [Ktedonobacterales bacterium]|nr:DUF2231 domain-containing protein [Ktedonobacterales bacterium]
MMPTIRPAELHPIIVHFPIALLITSVVLDVIALITRRRHLLYGATWVLAFGVAGALAAGLTGSLSEHSAHITSASVSQILATHQALGFATGVVFASLLGLRLLWLSPDILAAMSPRYAVAQRVGVWLQDALPGLERRQLSPLLIAAYMLGSVIGVILLGLTGFYGGSLVYDHGVGTPNSVILFLTSL